MNPGRLLLSLWLAGPAVPGAPADEMVPVRVRLASLSRHDLEVVRVDGDQLFLRPADAPAAEVVVPMAGLQDLHLSVPALYAEAQQLLYQQRPDEALVVLRRWVPRLVPLLGPLGEPGAGIVRRYLELLLRQQEWDDARGLVAAVPDGAFTRDFAAVALTLARALHAAGRTAEAVEMLARLAQHPGDDEVAQAVEQVADELGRAGGWGETHRLLLLLGVGGDQPAQLRRRLRVVYVENQLGRFAAAAERLASLDETQVPEPERPLYGLLLGQQALRQGRLSEGLDVLSRSLVLEAAGSRWAVELETTLATGYRADGREAVAAAIEADLERLHHHASAPPPPDPRES